MGQRYYNGRTHWEYGTPVYQDGRVVRRLLGPWILAWAGDYANDPPNAKVKGGRE